MKKFVYPEHKSHAAYREITRENDLPSKGSVYYIPQNVKPEVAFPQGIPNFVKTQNQIDHMFMNEAGINLCYYYIEGVMKILSGGFRLSRHCHDRSGPVAHEPISWGIGVFRPVRTEQSAYQSMLGFKPFPKISSKATKVLKYQLLDSGAKKDPQRPWLQTKTLYETTNIILADSYGELEQLFRRRNDSQFLRNYLRDLQENTEFKTISANLFAPAGMNYYSSLFVNGWLNHIKLGLWKEPPKTKKELIERVGFLLEETIVDRNPIEVITSYEHKCYMGNTDVSGML